jgi:putative FmdB family regulatory protein
MPSYDFKCEKCGNIIETLQKFDDPAPMCDKCKDIIMIRLICAPAFKFAQGGGVASGIAMNYASKKRAT